MMNSAYSGKDWQSAISSAAQVAADNRSDKDDVRRAKYVEAKSLLATSQREKAFTIIQDSYDRGKFEEVETLVYKLSDSGTNQTYWLAKAFIALGDSFADRGEMKQAKATFESIRDGYTPEGKADEVLDNVNMRLRKIEERGE